MTIRYLDNFQAHLENLSRDIYAQPPDPGHACWAEDSLVKCLPKDISTILDVGCGQGFMKTLFEKRGLSWEGVTLGADVDVCRENKIPVHEADFSFLPLPGNSHDLIYARHVLEHSPCPVPTLMEWRRVSRQYLILVAPAPDYWGYRGRNHYSIAPMEQLKWWLERSGWECVIEDIFNNRDPLFLENWRLELIKRRHLKAEKMNNHFPAESLDVEYRFLCRKGEEVLV